MAIGSQIYVLSLFGCFSREQRISLHDPKASELFLASVRTSVEDAVQNEVLQHGQRTLTVWKLDRLGWSMKHLIEIVTENIDTTTSGGRLVFHLFGALAQFERDLIRERTRAGLQAAEERGDAVAVRPLLHQISLPRPASIWLRGSMFAKLPRASKLGKLRSTKH